MGLIFFLSSQSDLDTGLGTIDFILRKIGHATVFGVLCALWYWTLAPHAAPGAALAIAVVIALAYAASDEIHQGFVAGRTGAVTDVAIDAAGIAVTAILISRFRSRATP